MSQQPGNRKSMSGALGRLSRKFKKGAKRRRKKLNVALKLGVKPDRKKYGAAGGAGAAVADLAGRGRAFKGESIKTSSDFTCAHFPKSAATGAALRSIILDPANNLTVLSSLPSASLVMVIDAMQSRELASNEKLLSGGEASDALFIVETGALADKRDPLAHKRVACELALFMSMPIAADIVAVGKTTVWYIDRVTFRTHLAQASLGNMRSRIPRGTLALEYGSTVVEGALKKLAFHSRANWKKRWMQVSIFLPGTDPDMPDVEAHAQLYYFKSKKRPRAGGVSRLVPQGHVLIDHEAVCEVVSSMGKKREFCFRILTKGDEYIFAAESEKINKQWVSMITETIGEVKEAHVAMLPPTPPAGAGFSPALPSTLEEDDETEGAADAVAALSLDAAADAALPPNWEEIADDAGKVYYHNTVSGETQWVRPSADGASLDEDDAWVEHKSSSGDAYFYNNVTHESAWEDPRPAARAKKELRRQRTLLAASQTKREQTVLGGAGDEEEEEEDESPRRGSADGGDDTELGDAEEAAAALGPWVPSVTYDELTMLKTLGQGSFGKVLLASRGSETYAVKILIKEFIVENKATGMVMAEKNAMAAFSGDGRRSPFITELVGTYQDASNLYFILELLQGGELLALLDRKEFLGEGECAFYMACVTEAMHALHSRGWLFRDLKPDNILIDAQGYAKIADFGLAKNVGFDPNTQTTYTLCGTAQYMSPQVISGEGYGKDADWWAVGVVMFECLDGLTPFVEDEEEDEDPYRSQMRIFNNILSKPIQYQPSVSSDARKLIGQLLERNVSKRIADRQDMRAMSYFRANGVNWDALEALDLTPPWVPPVKDAFDISNSFQAQTEDEDTSLGATLAALDHTFSTTDWSEGF